MAAEHPEWNPGRIIASSSIDEGTANEYIHQLTSSKVVHQQWYPPVHMGFGPESNGANYESPRASTVTRQVETDENNVVRFDVNALPFHYQDFSGGRPSIINEVDFSVYDHRHIMPEVMPRGNETLPNPRLSDGFFTHARSGNRGLALMIGGFKSISLEIPDSERIMTDWYASTA